MARRRRRRHISIKGCLKECFRLFCKPFRRASPCTSVTILFFYCCLISVATWITKELDDADAQDITFAQASRKFTCTVITRESDNRLQWVISPASRYLGDGVDVHIQNTQRKVLCPELCTRGQHGTLIPYYCYHAEIKIDKDVRASLQSMDINCTNTCLSTGIITHRILTRRPTFALPWYMRFPTLISTVQADERRAERLEKLRPTILSPSSAQEQQKQKQPADVSGTDVADATGAAATQGLRQMNGNNEGDDVYGMARKTAFETATCYLNPLPYYHPACIIQRRDALYVNSSNITNITATNHTNSSSIYNRRFLIEDVDALEDAVQKEKEKLKLKVLSAANSLFSYCPEAEDPCKWPSLSWDIPTGPRPLGKVLIIILSCQWSFFVLLLWFWFPRIARSIVQSISKCVASLKERTERFKTNPLLRVGKCAKQQQICFLRMTSWGEGCVRCCSNLHRSILICGSKIGLVRRLCLFVVYALFCKKSLT